MKIKQVRRAFVVMKYSLSGKPKTLQNFIAKTTLLRSKGSRFRKLGASGFRANDEKESL